MAVLHARPRPRGLAPGPGAHPGAGPGRAAAAQAGGAGGEVRCQVGGSLPERGRLATRRGGRRSHLAGGEPGCPR